MRKTLRVAGVAALALAGALAVPTTADAHGSPEPWEPVEEQGLESAAGVYCEFAWHTEIVSQAVERRTVDRYDDGTVRTEQYRGELIADFVREDTGQRYRADMSGDGTWGYYPDGANKYIKSFGPYGNGFKAGQGYPKGYYVLDGFHLVTYEPDGTENMTVDGGTETDICEELA